MMTALATVVSVSETNNEYKIDLSCEQQTSCSSCASKKSCGTGMVSKAIGSKNHKWQLTSSVAVKPGQVIEIGLPEKDLIQFASLVYLLPLFMLMLGALFGEQVVRPMISGGEGWTILASALFMFAGIWLAKALSTRLKSESEQVITLLRVLGETITLSESKK